MQKLPKVLVLSATGVGSNTATGDLMAKLFANWSRSNLLALNTGHRSSLKFRSTQVSSLTSAKEVASLLKAIQAFAPDVIYYRPVDNPPEFSSFASHVLSVLGRPYVIHMMDDWPSRLAVENPVLAESMDLGLRGLLSKASCCLSICEAMSFDYQQRYGVEFVPIANGVALDQIGPLRTSVRPFRVVYSGALAADMTYQSVLDVAEAVSSLSTTHDISLEIRTMPWFAQAGREIANRPGVVLKKTVSKRQYAKMLNQSDCLLIAYNFDDATKLYTRLSLANKLPECLASGVPVLAYGPAGIATIDTLVNLDVAAVVDRPGVEGLKSKLQELMADPSLGQGLATAAMGAARDSFNLVEIQNHFQSLIGSAAMKNNHSSTVSAVDEANEVIAGPHSREAKAHIDETKIIASYVAKSPAGLMIDVGAHHGSAFMPFQRVGWTVHGFEPDPKNRSYLEDRYHNLDRFELDSRAVSDVDGNTVPFYTSEESTGISGLSAFRDSHEKVCEVETVTLKTYMQAKNIEKVDFLKIDTEGFDLMVLKGFPWDKVKPDFVECEFEDNKTTPLGYEFDDIAQFLVDQGYHVFVSEWHPIVRYGIKHQWRGLFRYPGKLQSNQAWGNLLAFSEAPDMQRLGQAVAANADWEKTADAPLDIAEIHKISEPHVQRHASSSANSNSQPSAKVGTNVNQPPLSSNRLVNYLRMFTHFYASPPGWVMLMSVLAVGVCGYAFSRVPEPWSYAAALLGLLILMFVPAYLYARNRFLTTNEIANNIPIYSPPQDSSELTKKALAVLEQRLLKTDAEMDEFRVALLEVQDIAAVSESKVADSQKGFAALAEESGAIGKDFPLLVAKYMDLKRQVLRLENSIVNLSKD